MRSSTTKPFARKRRIHSPYGSWKVDLTVVDPVQPEVVECERLADAVGAHRPADGLDRCLVIEREQAAGPQESGRFRDRPVGIGE